MDPIKEWLQKLQEARAEGYSDAEITQALRRNGAPFASVRVLEREARVQGVSLDEAPAGPEGGRRNPLQAVAPFIQGITGGFASDALNLAEKVPGVPEGSLTGPFQRNLQNAREDNPLRSGASQVAGSIAGLPRLAATNVAIPAARAIGGATGRGAAAATRAAGGGTIAQLAMQGLGQGTGAVLGGAAVGALEGGAMAFGEAYGEDRTLGDAAPGAIVGGVLGGAIPGVQAGVGHVRRVNQLKANRGNVLAAQAEEVAEGLGTLQRVEGAVEEADNLRRAAFQQFDNTPASVIPEEIGDFIRTDPTARRALRRSSSQEARKFQRALQKYDDAMAAIARGEDVPMPEMPTPSARLADAVRKRLGDTADSFARATPGGRLPDQTVVREAQRAEGALTDLLEGVPGFSEGVRATRAARTTERAFQLGQKASAKGVGADVVENLLDGKTTRLGMGGSRPVPQSLARGADGAVDPQAAEAFRAGLLRNDLLKLRQGQQTVDGFVSDLLTGTELRTKLRASFGSDEAFNAFVQEAQRAKDIGSLQGMLDKFVKYGGFIFLGSSLGGGILTEVLR